MDCISVLAKTFFCCLDCVRTVGVNFILCHPESWPLEEIAHVLPLLYAGPLVGEHMLQPSLEEVECFGLVECITVMEELEVNGMDERLVLLFHYSFSLWCSRCIMCALGKCAEGRPVFAHERIFRFAFFVSPIHPREKGQQFFVEVRQ